MARRRFAVQSVVFIFETRAVESHRRNTALTPNTPVPLYQRLNRLVGWKRKHFVLFRVPSLATRVHRAIWRIENVFSLKVTVNINFCFNPLSSNFLTKIQ